MKTPKFKDSETVFVSGTVNCEPGPAIVLGYDPDRELYRVRLARSGARIAVPEVCLAVIE